MGQFFRSLVNAPLEFRIQHFQLPRLPVKLSENPGDCQWAASSIGFRFAKLVELFDQHGVSFVSITQSFNTTSSMGRLTLNVLLSFAQFERETGDRLGCPCCGGWAGLHSQKAAFKCLDEERGFHSLADVRL
jgi:Resolvase, N terminal domain